MHSRLQRCVVGEGKIARRGRWADSDRSSLQKKKDERSDVTVSIWTHGGWDGELGGAHVFYAKL